MKGKAKKTKGNLERVPTGKTKDKLERVPTGITGLDKLIGGGFVKDSTVMVRGDSGTGKTLFCLQYLYKGIVDHNEPGIYIGFSESQEDFFAHGKVLGWDIETLVKENKLAIIRYEPHEVVNMMKGGGGSLRDTVESIGAKRVVIDSLTAYEMVFENQYKANQSVLDFFSLMKRWDATVLVSSEFPVKQEQESGGKIGFLTHGIINLYHPRKGSKRIRTLEILKMRDTAHDERVHIFSIGKDGLKLRRADLFARK